MKRFIQIYAVCIVSICIFFFCGGFFLFDLSLNVYRAAAAIAFLLAIVIHVYMGQAEKIEELEQRLEKLERQTKGD